MDIAVTFPGGKKVNAHLEDFVIETDQPVKLGGDGSAPEPFAYCLASIATCAGFYVLSYLQARDLPVAGVKLLQTHEADEKGNLIKVLIQIELPPQIDKKHHPIIVRAANHCAVKKMIESQPEFAVSVKVS